MKITGFFHGIFFKNQIILRVNDNKDLQLIKKLFDGKKERECRSKKEILLKCVIDAEFQKRSFKQLASVWKLVTVIFESMENRKPTENERYDLYLDLLEEYADKTPNRLRKNELRPVHISEANTMSASRFIDGLLFHLSTECDLKTHLQAEVRDVLYAWEIWRGKQATDINDERSIKDMRAVVVYSEASGRTPVEFHHIITRGANESTIDKAWNILALTHDEHMFFHKVGWDAFLEKYPHLRGRVEKAYQKASELLLSKDDTCVDVTKLAELAIGE